MKPGSKLEERKSARAKLAGAVQVTVRLQDGTRLEAKLHELSATGGVLHLQNPLVEGACAILVFESKSGLVKETAEMLAPRWATRGSLQPFRFSELSERNLKRLQDSLKHLLGDRA